MEKMSKEQENQILRALENAADMITQGHHPSDALHKVAEEGQFTPPIIQRMAEAINTSRVMAHLKTANGDERASSFPLADARDVLERMYPATLSAPAEKQAAFTVPSCYALPESGNFMRPKMADTVAAPREKFAAYAIDEETRDRRMLDKRAGLRKLAESARSLYRQQFNKFVDMAKEAAFYFRRLEHEPFELVELKTYGQFGKKAQFAMGMLHQIGNLREKRASYDLPPPNMVFDYTREPYKNIAGMMDQAKVLYKAGEEAIDAENLLNRFEKEHGLNQPVEKQAMLLEGVLTGRHPAPFVKRSFDPASGALEAGTKAMGLKEPGSDTIKREAMGEVLDPEHEGEMQGVKVKAMLNDFMSNDPIISSYDPQMVTTAYNQLAQLSPMVAQQPAVMRGMLRKTLQQEGVIEPFEAGQMADIERKLKGPTGQEPEMPMQPK